MAYAVGAVVALAFVLCFVRRRPEWWRVESLAGFADLGLKLVGVLAGIAAAAFLAPKGVISSTVVPAGRIDEAALSEAYDIAAREPPEAVLRVVRDFNAQPFFGDVNLLLSYTDFNLGYADQSFGTIADSFGYSSDPLLGLIDEQRREILEIVYGPAFSFTVPPYAIALALAGDLSPDHLDFALRAIEQARSTHLTLRVVNEGDAPIAVTKITPPRGLAPSETVVLPIRLDPSASQTLEYSRARGSKAVATGGFQLETDSSTVVSSSLLKALAGAFGVLLLSVLLISLSKREAVT